MAVIYNNNDTLYGVTNEANIASGTTQFEALLKNILPTWLISDYQRNKTQRQKDLLDADLDLYDLTKNDNVKVIIAVGVIVLLIIVMYFFFRRGK